MSRRVEVLLTGPDSHAAGLGTGERDASLGLGFSGQDKGPEERSPESGYRKQPGHESPETPDGPMLDVFGRVAQLAQVFEPQHVPDAPEGLIGDAGQEVASADPPNLAQRARWITDMFEYFQDKYNIEGIGGKRKLMQVAHHQPAFRALRFGQPQPFQIQVHTERAGSKSPLDPAENHSFPATGVQNQIGFQGFQHLIDCPEELPVGEPDQSVSVRVFGLCNVDVRSGLWPDSFGHRNLKVILNR